MELLNRPIKIDGSENKGTITIEFYGKDDLKKLISNIEDIL
jgi:hypothetical protein